MITDGADAVLARAVRKLIDAGLDPDDALTDARLLLLHATGWTRSELVLQPRYNFRGPEVGEFQRLVARRATREPLPYLTGTREFHGLAFKIQRGVLIPRPETEFVVDIALAGLKDVPSPRIADVGTGSGIIAVTIAVRRTDASVIAVDISQTAVELAGRNANLHGVRNRVQMLEGDLLQPAMAYAPFDAIVSNPPYVDPAQIPLLQPEVRDWEPPIALGIHKDPLHFYRRLAAESPTLLRHGGMLIVEVGAGQADDVAALWRDVAHLDSVTITPDYAGIGRVVAGILP